MIATGEVSQGRLLCGSKAQRRFWRGHGLRVTLRLIWHWQVGVSCSILKAQEVLLLCHSCVSLSRVSLLTSPLLLYHKIRVSLSQLTLPLSKHSVCYMLFHPNASYDYCSVAMRHAKCGNTGPVEYAQRGGIVSRLSSARGSRALLYSVVASSLFCVVLCELPLHLAMPQCDCGDVCNTAPKKIPRSLHLVSAG